MVFGETVNTYAISKEKGIKNETTIIEASSKDFGKICIAPIDRITVKVKSSVNTQSLLMMYPQTNETELSLTKF